jgi:hypothetical protein
MDTETDMNDLFNEVKTAWEIAAEPLDMALARRAVLDVGRRYMLLGVGKQELRDEINGHLERLIADKRFEMDLVAAERRA